MYSVLPNLHIDRKGDVFVKAAYVFCLTAVLYSTLVPYEFLLLKKKKELS